MIEAAQTTSSSLDLGRTAAGLKSAVRRDIIFLRWIPYLSYAYYGYSLLLLAQWYNVDLNVSCKYFGYNATIRESNICPAEGNGILKCFNISYETYYWNIIALCIIFAGYHVSSYFIILYRTKHDR